MVRPKVGCAAGTSVSSWKCVIRGEKVRNIFFSRLDISAFVIF